MEIERKERLKRDWRIYASRCRDAIKATKQSGGCNSRTPSYGADLSQCKDADLWELWQSISVLTPMQEKLTVLSKMAARQYGWLQGKALRKKRRKSNKVRHSILRLEHSECFVCGAPACIRHHVIQLHHGGTNTPLNVIPLCYGCHGEIHPWLKN